MAGILGRVRAGSRPIQGLLVEAFDVGRGFEKYLPLDNRHAISLQSIKRLGSAITTPGGEFRIEYNQPEAKVRFLRQCRRFDIWVTVSACCEDQPRTVFIYQSPDVRYGALSDEHYVICLPPDYTDINNPLSGQSDITTPETIKKNHEAEQALLHANREIAQANAAAKEAVRKEFREQIAPNLVKQMSLVERNHEGNPLDEHFVETDEPVRKKAEIKIVEAVQKNLATDIPRNNRLSLRGRVSLTGRQLDILKTRKIEAESDEEAFTVTEEDLFATLESEDGSGNNPEVDTQIVNRVDAIVRFCREKTEGEKCLVGDLNDDGDGDNDEGPVVESNDENGNGEPTPLDAEPVSEGGTDNDGQPITDPQDTDSEDRTGSSIELETLKDNLPAYIASVLDERSVLDPADPQLPVPGSRLDEESITSADSFPSLTLPPGPADVPAYHDFFDLQIAFKPVWQEALDESIFGDIEAVYEKYVEDGGDAANFLKGTFLFESSVGTFLKPTVDVNVQKHVKITNEEWAALTAPQRTELSSIASQIGARLTFLWRPKLQDNKYLDGVTGDDLKTFNNTKQYIMAIVNELRQQAERIVAVARAELERQAAGKSIVPGNELLRQLRNRLLSAYPAKYFAANKTQRSVNFGLLLTYRQRWTPTAYQVGELIKSIPLAPKEIRKYSKKTVRKLRRSRKEIESNLESLKSETNSTTRAEAEIVQDAMDRTNFNASANGSFTVGVWSGGGTSSLTQDTASKSAETKKRMHEAVVKAAREYRNEIKVELETEQTFEEEFQESGELINPNEELTVNYLFYELQRRYRVEERLHRMMSVVLVAQEIPKPAEINEDWIIAHRWILNRVLLDDGFKQPLRYVAEDMVGEQFALEETRKSLEQQRRLVEDLKEDVSTSRTLTESRYSALQRSMERSARATQQESEEGGLFGFARKLTTVGVVGDLVDRFIGSEGETPEAARVREAAAQDAYQREMKKLRDQEARLAQMNASLSRATNEFSERLGAYLSNVVRVQELKNHLKDNLTHYMQAIWMHEPFQQRWLRLKDVPVPVLKRPGTNTRRYRIGEKAITGSLANVAHLRTTVHEYEVWPELELPDPGTEEEVNLETVPLYQVADIDDLIGFRANYMIFTMMEANALTDFMMEPYVERAAGGFGITDPDDLGNMNLEDFADYICCLKRELSGEEFDELVPTLKEQLKKLLQSPLRDDEEIVVPMDAMYIEALPGSRPILEDFKLLHRQIDAADAQEDVRLKKLEKIRYAQRLLEGRLDDPEADARYEFTGNPELDFALNTPTGSEGP